MADDLGRFLEDGATTTANVRRVLERMFPSNPRHEVRNQGPTVPIDTPAMTRMFGLPPEGRPRAQAQEKIAEGLGAWGAGPALWEAGKGALEASRPAGSWEKFLNEHGADLATLLVPVPGIRGARPTGKHAPTRLPSLEAYVDFLQKTDPAHAMGTKPLFRWEGYLDADPTFTIGGRPHDFEIPHANHGKLSREAGMLQNPATKSRIAEAAEPSLYEGPRGNPVNPWYWPHVMFETIADKIGPEAAHEWLTQYLGYNATTSMMTSPRRAAVESWMVDYNNRHDIPIDKLQPWELTGGAYPNKVELSGNVAKLGTDAPEAGIQGKRAQKIRPYWLDLMGVGGNEPSYSVGDIIQRKQTPVTLDSIMAKPELFRLRDKAGEPKERFLGPNYTTAQGVIHELGEKMGGVAGSDMQAAPWQTTQFNAHGKPDYALTHTAIVNKVIHDIAAKNGEEPAKVLDDLVHARKRPPTDIYSIAAPLAASSGLPGILLQQSRDEIR